MCDDVWSLSTNLERSFHCCLLVVGNGLSMERIPICGANGGLLMVIDVSNEFIE